MYKVKIQLRDTTIECPDGKSMDKLYSDVLDGLEKIGIPQRNIIVKKIETAIFPFDGQEHEKVLISSEE